MRECLAIAISLLIAAACSSSMRQGPRTPLSTKELVAKNTPAVVFIEVETSAGEKRAGTGFIVSKDGLIATNLHVIQFASQVEVRLANGDTYPVQRVVASDPARDLVLIRIDRSDLAPLQLGDSDQVAAGDRVVAIGNPLGTFDFTVSDGLISSVRPITQDLTMLQISAPISQGSSGGPLFNPYGEVIGVATAISREGQNLNFAVPINYLRPLLAAKGPGESLAEFQARLWQKLAAAQLEADAQTLPCGVQSGPIPRDIPCHEVSLLDGCKPGDVANLYRDITQAIEVGAPVYNDVSHEACFVIYRDVANAYLARPEICGGIHQAFTQGLERVEAADNFTLKAWAMRDTFDGLLRVISHKVLLERR